MTLEELVTNHLSPRKATKIGEVWVRCPFCGDEKYRMGINTVSGLAHCFRASCEWKTSDRKHLFRELCKVLNLNDRMDDARVKKKKKKVEHVKIVKRMHLPNEFELLVDHHTKDDIELRAWKYLILKRGMTEEQIKQHKLGFCATGDFAWRIIIPVFKKGRLVAYTGRDFSELPDIDPKYRNSEGQKHLYNVPKTKKHKVILIEGAFDVYSVERADVPGFDIIGRLGTGLGKNAMRVLLDYDEIVLWPDPDKGGIDLTVDAAKSLSKRGRVVSIIIPQDGDVDPGKLGETEYGLKEIAHKIRTRIPWNESVHTKLAFFAAFV